MKFKKLPTRTAREFASTKVSKHQEKTSDDGQVQEGKSSHCLGIADTEAPVYSDKAPADCFKKTVNESPRNELYQKSLEAAAKARETHLELLRQQGFQQAIGGGQATTSNANAEVEVEDSYGKFVNQSLKMFIARSDLKYDMCGWIILVVGIVSWVGMPKSNVPPPR